MQNPRQNESQAGIEIAGKNTNSLRYADDTTLMAESEKELKSLLKSFPQFVVIHTVKGFSVVNNPFMDYRLVKVKGLM